MFIEYHRNLLRDAPRNAAFHEALKRVITRNKTTVADIGAGTGVLGFLASKLGARQVHLYEAAEVGILAEKLLKRNGVRNCTVIRAHSTEVKDPERVDVVVSETLGNYAFEEHIIETLNDARKRFVKPGGVIIPRGIRQFACPVVTRRYLDELTVWDRVGYGLNFEPAQTMSLNNIYVRTFKAEDLLNRGEAAAQWDALSFDRHNSTERKGSASWTAKRKTTIFGVAVWWSAELVEGISLSTGPLDPATHWEQLYFPVLEPIQLDAGEELTVRLRSTTSYRKGTIVSWKFEAGRPGQTPDRRQELDLERGSSPPR